LILLGPFQIVKMRFIKRLTSQSGRGITINVVCETGSFPSRQFLFYNGHPTG
jgi:hypothetical protein